MKKPNPVEKNKGFPVTRPMVIVDTETTGGNPLFSRMIEIAIIRLEPGKGARFFSTLINPERPVSPSVLELTGIRAEDLTQAPPFAEVAETIQEWLKDALFIAHNARFDYGFIKHEFWRLERRFSQAAFCSVQFSRKLYPDHSPHNLDSLIERFGLNMKNRHRAMDDAMAVWEFLDKAYSEKGAQFLECFESECAVRKFKTHLSEDVLNSLPEGPGVYVFYGEHGEALYAGQSLQLRETVQRYFEADSKKSRNRLIAEETYDLEVFSTAGIFSAWMNLDELIQRKQPKYNRNSKKSKFKTIRWPFRSPVLLTETSFFEKKADSFLADKWKILAKVSVADDGSEDLKFTDCALNYRVYRILKRAVAGDFQSLQIRPVKSGEVKKMLLTENSVPVIHL